MKKLRVLVVEDNDESRQLYVLVLTRAGFEVKEAVGGEEALQMPNECAPAPLTTAPRTPSRSALDFIRRIRGEGQWAPLPILAISAYSHEQLAHAALQGATRVLRKPFEPNRLLSAVFE